MKTPYAYESLIKNPKEKTTEVNGEEIKEADEEGSVITEPMGNSFERRKIKEDNIGFRLLKAMGWKEGEGIGMNRAAIVDPISVSVTFRNRRGFGRKPKKISFHVRDILEDFSADRGYYDLAFDPSFEKGYRAQIQK